MTDNAMPDYEAYRAEIDLIVPQASHLIAIRRHMTRRNPELLLQDMQEQLPPDVFETFWPKMKEDWVSCIATRDASKLMAFCLDKKDGMKPFAYISTPDSLPRVQKIMSVFSKDKISPFRLKFDVAANRPEIATWFLFFHELSHALISARAVPYQKDHFYYRALEETVCDSFATLHTLRKFGDTALPLLKAFADMRWSAFSTVRESYFTGPAIMAILDGYISGQLQVPDPGIAHDAGFALAVRYASQNFLDAGDLASVQNLNKNMTMIDIFVGRDLRARLDCFFGEAEEGQPPVMEARIQNRQWQAEAFARACQIKSECCYPTIGAAMAARIKERFFPAP